jgi:hypothetical protein
LKFNVKKNSRLERTSPTETSGKVRASLSIC